VPVPAITVPVADITVGMRAVAETLAPTARTAPPIAAMIPPFAFWFRQKKKKKKKCQSEFVRQKENDDTTPLITYFFVGHCVDQDYRNKQQNDNHRCCTCPSRPKLNLALKNTACFNAFQIAIWNLFRGDGSDSERIEILLG
jgi:hypothetical protein